MNGWMRLWLFISVIWLLLVVTVSSFLLLDNSYRNPDGPWINHRLSNSSKKFFENLAEGENGAHYSVSVEFDDGSKYEIRLPVLTQEGLETIPKKIRKLAEEKEATVADSAIEGFSAKVRELNSAAQKADEARAQALREYVSDMRAERKQLIIYAVLTFVLPVLGALLMGLGVAWVRRGFRKAGAS